MANYLEYPLPYGINLIKDLSEFNLYQLPRSQTVIFPFTLGQASAIRVDAGHSSFYDNQNGTLSAWPSDSINGRSIVSETVPTMARVSLQGEGCSWLFYPLDLDITSYEPTTIQQYIYPNQQYYMCFQNKENKDNGLYVKFTYL